MTPRERLLTTMRGETADRVPIVLPGFQFASQDAVEAIEEPLRRQIAERVFEAMHFDVGVGSAVNRYLVTPPQRMRHERKNLGDGRHETHGVIDTPKGELTFLSRWDPVSHTTWTIKYPCETHADIEKIASIPWETPPSVQPPQLDDLPPSFERRGIVRTGISSPFVCVAGMMPYQTFLMMCATDLDLMIELTEVCRQRILAVLEVLFSEPGIEYVWIGGSEWVTPPMGSPALYDTLVQEQEKSLIDYVHAHSDAVIHIHCHGHVRHTIGRCIERGAEFTEPVEPPPDGDITMAEAKALAAGRLTLGGNIEARVICYESEETVEQAVRAAFEGGKERFILRPTESPSPAIAEREFRNWMTMIDVWEELSPIP